MSAPAAAPAPVRATVLPSTSSAVLLPEESLLRRRPRFALRKRPPAFHEAYESRVLFYDCFWHSDGERVLLVGPPPVNLDYGAFRFSAGGATLTARFHTSLSVTITELMGVPAGAMDIAIDIGGGQALGAPIQPNASEALAGSRLLFTINKDNELSWVAEWALWHSQLHGTDAVVLVDNGSRKYGRAELEATLATVPGLRHVSVLEWPHTFGPIDPAVFANAYWARFLQISSMSVVLRRFGARAYGLLDCDVDELALTRSGNSAYDIAHQSAGGLVVFRGTWIEAIPDPGNPALPPHRAYRHRLADQRAAASRQRKWALDPSRDWVSQLSVHPYWHWIEGRPRNAKSMPTDISYRHFRGINTNWKSQRTAAPDAPTVRDAELDAAFARFLA